jgi:hypothetical protein
MHGLKMCAGGRRCSAKRPSDRLAGEVLHASCPEGGRKSIFDASGVRLGLPSAQISGEKKDEADQHDEPKSTPADERSAEVKAASAEQQNQDQQYHEDIHG